MKLVIRSLFVAVGCLFIITSNAAVVRIDVALDLNDGTIIDVNAFGQPPTQVWVLGPISVPAVSLTPGDLLQIDVRFAAGQALDMTAGSWGRQRLWVSQSEGMDCSYCTLETTLTDISLSDGNVEFPVTSLTQFFNVNGSGLLGSVDSPLTDTMFALTGFTLLTEFGPTTIVRDFSEIRVMLQADQVAIRPVPLPAAGWLLGLALGGLFLRPMYRALDEST